MESAWCFRHRTRLPSNLGHTLHRLSPHRTMWELSLFIGIGGTGVGREDPSSHQATSFFQF